MTRAFIADASVAIGWVHPAQATSETTAMLEAIEAGAVLEVPALWPLEVANALTVLVRRRKLAEEDRQTGLGWLRGLPVRMDHEMASLAFSKYPPWSIACLRAPMNDAIQAFSQGWARADLLWRRPALVRAVRKGVPPSWRP